MVSNTISLHILKIVIVCMRKGLYIHKEYSLRYGEAKEKFATVYFHLADFMMHNRRQWNCKLFLPQK